MAIEDEKSHLLRYLQTARDAVVWKLDGLGEYDLRRPLVPTGSNLLGLLKHLAGTEIDYFADTFGRPFADETPWRDDDAPDNADMWATRSESSESIRDLYRRACDHSNATIAALALDAPGVVPWWPAERRDVDLRQVLVHMIAETNRHAGHADILRELIDGSAGLRRTVSNLPEQDTEWWERYRADLEELAKSFDTR